MFNRLAYSLAALTIVVAGHEVAAASQQGDDFDAHGRAFVQRKAREFHQHGQSFRPVGASNYYLMYKSQVMVDAVLEKAAASGFNTIRLWGALDIGNQDGSNSIRGKADGVYFQYWDGTAPAYNDGADGLQHLDYVIHKAGQLDLKLIMPFVNNWNDFGGMDQYVRWLGGQYHDQFYTEPQIRQWYKNWISHLLNRVNTYNGIAYKDDATILSWELANEPRCRAYGVYPQSDACNTQTLIDWAEDVSGFVKTIDRRHLLSVGDEGFYCIPGSSDWTENCGEGVDTLALADLPKIDVMSLHLYPDAWGKTPEWGTEWIKRHIRDARRIRERAMLGEFGLRDKAIRNTVYKRWTDTIFANGGGGAMYWILSDAQDNGTPYPDYDEYTVYCPSPVCTTFSHFAAMMRLRFPLYFPPVADHDRLTVDFNSAGSLAPLANDITYLGMQLRKSSVDLDPATPGQQTSFVSAGGSFELQADGTLAFAPATDFSGEAVASYTVRDTLWRGSNPANLTVTVKPDPNAALKLFSFETGSEGWAPASWQTNAGSVSQSSDFASDGASSLKVDALDGGWFGLNLPAPLDLGAKTKSKFEIHTGPAGTSQNVALQVGDSYTWCEGTWGFVDANNTATVEVNLLSMSCGVPNIHNLRAMWIYFSGGGTYYLDNVRAE